FFPNANCRVAGKHCYFPGRVAGEHCCSPAPSERHVNLSAYAAQASLKAPRGTRWGASVPPARYWSGASERDTPETAPAARLHSSPLSPEPVVQTVSCGDTRGKSARFRVGGSRRVAQPLSVLLPNGIRFLPHPLPAVPSAHLAVGLP